MHKLIVYFALFTMGFSTCGENESQKQAAIALDRYTWSKDHEGVRVGCRIASMPTVVDVVLANSDQVARTNFVPNLYVYRERPRFSISLRDGAGQKISKTAKGKEFEIDLKPIDINWLSGMKKPLERVALLNQWPMPIGNFDIDECFKRKAAGRYQLEVKVSAFKNTRGRHFAPVVLGVVKLTVELGHPDE